MKNAPDNSRFHQALHVALESAARGGSPEFIDRVLEKTEDAQKTGILPQDAIINLFYISRHEDAPAARGKRVIDIIARNGRLKSDDVFQTPPLDTIDLLESMIPRMRTEDLRAHVVSHYLALLADYPEYAHPHRLAKVEGFGGTGEEKSKLRKAFEDAYLRNIDGQKPQAAPVISTIDAAIAHIKRKFGR